MMITSSEAGRLLGGLSSETLRDYAEKKLVDHERIGIRGRYRFSFDSLRKYAKGIITHQHTQVCNQLAKQAEEAENKLPLLPLPV